MKTIVMLFAFSTGTIMCQDLQIIVPAEVQILFTSPQGLRVGYSSTLDSVLNEIPGSGYVYGSLGSDEINGGSGPDDYYELFVNDGDSNGTIALEVTGMYTTRYFIDISIGIAENISAKKTSYIMKGATEVFQLGIGKGTMTVTKEAKGTLLKDVSIAFQLKELGKKPLYIDLKNRIELYDRWIQRGDSVKARQELGKLEKKLDEVYEKSKGPSKDPNHFIKEEAYRILKEDVAGLMGR